MAVHIQRSTLTQQIPQCYSCTLYNSGRAQAAQIQAGEFHQNPGNAAVLLQANENGTQGTVGSIVRIDGSILNSSCAVIIIVDLYSLLTFLL